MSFANPTHLPTYQPLMMAEQADQTPNPVEAGKQTSILESEAQPTVQTDPVDAEEEPEEDIKSRKVTLADLSAKGTTLYAHKKYEEAADVLSTASVLQAEINGETAPENAEVLFHYGRSLFKVGQSKSDVLGGQAATDNKNQAKQKQKVNGKARQAQTVQEPARTTAEQVTQEGVGIVAGKTSVGDEADTTAGAKKPLFQFTGDENFVDSDEDEEDAEGDAEQGEEEEEDELQTAFEILDLARVCYEKQLQQLSQEGQDGRSEDISDEESPAIRHIKERLAETHDALSEISLENERYVNAIEDGRLSLKYKLGLYAEESEIIAEAHFKLSLALEFASITTSGDDGNNTKREELDQGLRDEAVQEMELAIKSFKLKLQNKEVELATMASPEDNELARKAITEMKDVIADMEQRLVDLRKDPIDAKELLGGDANPIGGILGAALGESAAETQARVDEAKKNATDLTGLVRKKKPSGEGAAEVPALDSGKRKAGDEAGGESPKKAKVEDN
ncbi:NASP-related protein sim3 [Paramyrothecium foliicola]|nr:NASP-related protein sim3 [Paramyrothecium foliicola]